MCTVWSLPLNRFINCLFTLSLCHVCIPLSYISRLSIFLLCASSLRRSCYSPTLSFLLHPQLYNIPCVKRNATILTQYLIKHHFINTYVWHGGVLPVVLKISARWMTTVSFTPQLLYPREGSCRWLDRKLVGPRNRSYSFILYVLLEIEHRFLGRVARILFSFLSSVQCANKHFL
jgi:hypothetical protein